MPPTLFIPKRHLILMSILALTLLAIRIGYLTWLHSPTDFEHWKACALFAFLPWNLFLAWMPFWLAGLLHRYGRRDIMAWAVLSLWLLFLPNAPYLVTDLIHLRPRPDIPYWYDGLLLMIYAYLGMELFVASLQRVHHWWHLQFHARYSIYLLVVTILLTGFGIYAGRFFRWNSWDALLRPWIILEDVWAVICQPAAFLPDLWLALVFPLCLGVWYAGRGINASRGMG